MDLHNNLDIIDSRDIIDRVEELESDEANAIEDDEELSENDQEELNSLRELTIQGEESPDWKYGEALIRDSYFTEYAQELTGEIGVVYTDATWPNNHIDWDAAASELKFDYYTIDYDGVSYWMRS